MTRTTEEWTLREAPADVQAAGLAWLREGPSGLEDVRLEDVIYCLHCGEAMQVGAIRVSRQPQPPARDAFASEVYRMQKGIEVWCATEGCDGGVIDWSREPWSTES